MAESGRGGTGPAPPQTGLSRRRLLQLAAYGARGVTLLGVSAAARASGHSAPPCACQGSGLLGAYYYGNAGAPGWPKHRPDETRTDGPVCFSGAAGWPGAAVATPFSVRWVGRLCLAQGGEYRLRLAVDAAPGTQGWWLISLPVGKGKHRWRRFAASEEAVLSLDVPPGDCPAYDLDIGYHFTSSRDTPHVCFQWRRGASDPWLPVPAKNLSAG